MDVRNERKRVLIDFLTIWMNQKNIECREKFYQYRDRLIRDKYLTDPQIHHIAKFLSIEVGRDVETITRSLEMFKQPDNEEISTLERFFN